MKNTIPLIRSRRLNMNGIEHLEINPNYLNLNLEKMKLVQHQTAIVRDRCSEEKNKLKDVRDELKYLSQKKRMLKKLKKHFGIELPIIVLDAVAIPFVTIAIPGLGIAMTVGGALLVLDEIVKGRKITQLKKEQKRDTSRKLQLEMELPLLAESHKKIDAVCNNLTKEKNELETEQRCLQQQRLKDILGVRLSKSFFVPIEPNFDTNYPLTEEEQKQLDDYKIKVLRFDQNK